VKTVFPKSSPLPEGEGTGVRAVRESRGVQGKLRLHNAPTWTEAVEISSRGVSIQPVSIQHVQQRFTCQIAAQIFAEQIDDLLIFGFGGAG
jgi:hypothetical protein